MSSGNSNTTAPACPALNETAKAAPPALPLADGWMLCDGVAADTATTEVCCLELGGALLSAPCNRERVRCALQASGTRPWADCFAKYGSQAHPACEGGASGGNPGGGDLLDGVPVSSNTSKRAAPSNANSNSSAPSASASASGSASASSEGSASGSGSAAPAASSKKDSGAPATKVHCLLALGFAAMLAVTAL